jgi:hypothetical protein
MGFLNVFQITLNFSLAPPIVPYFKVDIHQKYYVSCLDNIKNNLWKVSLAHFYDFGTDTNMLEQMLRFQVVLEYWSLTRLNNEYKSL